ncbi:MAG: nitronate monooxygenase [Lentisphaeria bacterium]|nr:nitronate monooxygenase [Lentisphaeria bacterium]
MSTLTDKFFRRGNDFLGTQVPVICGAMTWISEPNLVSAVCNAGAFASLAGGNCPPDILESQIEQTRSLTRAAFGVNVITISPAYHAQLEMLQRNPVPVVIFAGGIPRGDEIAMMKAAGSKVMCFAPALAVAKRMLNYGVDALILEGTEAGGHIGLVGLNVLIQEVLFNFDEALIFVGGGIATGRFCAHLFMMGAAGVQLGTRFAIAEESCAHYEFKKAMLRADARDAVSPGSIDERLPVVPVRALKNQGLKRFGQLQLDLIGMLNQSHIDLKDAQVQVEKFWIGALRRAVQDGDVDNGSMMAGQAVGLLKKVETVQEIIDDLSRGVELELQKVKTLLM